MVSLLLDLPYPGHLASKLTRHAMPEPGSRWVRFWIEGARMETLYPMTPETRIALYIIHM